MEAPMPGLTLGLSAEERRDLVVTAIELERRRLQEAFADVYRPDGSIDEQALAHFARLLTGHHAAA